MGTTRRSKDWPKEIKQGSVSVKIYRTPNRGRELFTLAYYVDGVRRRETFASLDAAKSEGLKKVGFLASGRADEFTLSAPDRESYTQACRILAEFRMPLVAAVEEYAAARRRLNGRGLIEAVEGFLRNERTAPTPVSVADLSAQFLEEKADLSPHYVRGLKSHLKAFAAAFRCDVCTVNSSAISAWLRGLGKQGRTHNHYVDDLRTFFNFAAARGFYDRTEPNPAESVDRKAEASEIEVYSPAEMAALLSTARTCNGDRLAFLVLAGFAGIRSEEITRLDWKDIDLGEGHIEIRDATAKGTRKKGSSRRIIEIQPNLAAWLTTIKKESGPVVASPTVYKRMTYLAQEAGVTWKRNGLRHSFGTYRTAITKDFAQVSYEMGNSPAVIRRHYDAAAPKRAAIEWFNLMPGVVAAESVSSVA